MRCSSCDTSNPPEATRCEECGKPLTAKPARPRPTSEAIEERPQRRRPDDDAGDARRARRRRPDDEADEEEDRPRRRRRRSRDSDDVVAKIIPYKNPSALASYYLGVLSVVFFLGLLLVLELLEGPNRKVVFGLVCFLGMVSCTLACLFGVLGIRYARREPGARGTGHAITGLVLSSISVLGNVAVTLFAIYLFQRT
jgi:hypothetical protein